MPRPTPNDGDVWVGVKDPKKRKQIQDRLAQRARRKRLAEQKAITSTIVDLIPATYVRAPPHSLQDTTSRGSQANSSSPYNIPLITAPLNIYSALWNNGALLGLTCSALMPVISRDLGPSIPEALRPTTTQLVTLHPPWIDRFPFPTMRDNFISLLSVIDAEDFLRDIFNMPSFTLEPGRSSWDPTGWKIEKDFGMKWGFLFNPKLLETHST